MAVYSHSLRFRRFHWDLFVHVQWFTAMRFAYVIRYELIIIFLPAEFSKQHSRSLLSALIQRPRNLGSLRINELGHAELWKNLVTWSLFKNRRDIAREDEGEYIFSRHYRNRQRLEAVTKRAKDSIFVSPDFYQRIRASAVTHR